MESQWNHIIRRTRRRVIRGISLALQYAISRFAFSIGLP